MSDTPRSPLYRLNERTYLMRDTVKVRRNDLMLALALIEHVKMIVPCGEGPDDKRIAELMADLNREGY